MGQCTGPAREKPDARRVRRALLRWWAAHRRDYPWRKTRNRYRILIAELLLRRTRADQVAPVYRAFLRRFPTPGALARARPASIRTLLRPLGLRWRAENVVALARALRARRGVLPRGNGLAELPGVGPYVAAAVRCFAGSTREAVVDTNTARVAVRVFGLRPEGEPRRDPAVAEALDALASCALAARVNLALIDLAALVCRPTRPRCRRCPLESICLKEGVVSSCVIP